MKLIHCEYCLAVLSYTDGQHLYFPMQYINTVGRPALNLVELSQSPQVLTCGCGQTKRWFRRNTEYQIKDIPIVLDDTMPANEVRLVSVGH